jgi:hypothetical protein
MAMDRQGRQEGLQRPGAAARCSREEHPAPFGHAATAAFTTGIAAPDAPPAEGAEAAAAKPRESAATPKPSGVDKELEEKAKKAEAEEKAKRAAEEAKVAKAKADSCSRAREGKSTLDSGIRIAKVNAKGEREIMDDGARAAEQKRIQSVIDSDCK